MKLSSIKLVTIIAPQKLKEDIIQFFKEAGISGYTYCNAFGRGKEQLEHPERQITENIEFKILLDDIVAVSLIRIIAEEYFGKEKVIVFGQDANVIRHEKFEKVEYALKS